MKFIKTNILKRIFLFLLIVFVGIQFFPTKYNQTNVVLKEDFLIVFNPSENIEKIIKKSCYDCHSNNTNYPWYNKVQPIKWLLENHINEGKEELNFSEFDNYSKRKQKSKLKSIINQIKDNEMPMWSYTLIHQNAKISNVEKKILITWLETLSDKL